MPLDAISVQVEAEAIGNGEGTHEEQYSKEEKDQKWKLGSGDGYLLIWMKMGVNEEETKKHSIIQKYLLSAYVSDPGLEAEQSERQEGNQKSIWKVGSRGVLSTESHAAEKSSEVRNEKLLSSATFI